MSNMNIKVVAVEQQTAKSKAGKDYSLVEVTYKNMSFDGKVENKQHNQYGDKSVFETLKGAKAGDEFTITRQKDDNGYWQWIGISQGFGSAPQQAAPAKATSTVTAPATAAPKSNWESPEERAKKQLYIIRQSSLGHAIELLKTDKKSPDLQDVLATAKIFEQYVFGVNLDADPVEKLPTFDEDEDIPL